MSDKLLNSEEIALVDYLKVILKRKQWIVWIFVFALLIALGFILLKPKIYKSEAIIRIGTFQQVPLENPEELIEVLQQKAVLKQIAKIIGLNGPFKINDLERIKENLTIKTKEQTNLILITALGSSPKDAQALAQAVADFIVERHQKIFNQKKSLLQERLDQINVQIKNLENETQSLQANINRLASPTTQAQALALEAYLSNYQLVQDNINKLKDELNNLKFRLLEAQNSSLISSPSLPTKPINPGLKSVLIIAGLLGIFIGIFWVFCLEWWEQNKTRLKE